MGRSIEISGNSIVYLFYASSLAIVPIVAYFVVWPLDTLTSLAVAGLLAMLVLVAIADWWYWKSGALREHLSTAAKRTLPYDITYTPTADPGQMVKGYWQKTVLACPAGTTGTTNRSTVRLHIEMALLKPYSSDRFLCETAGR